MVVYLYLLILLLIIVVVYKVKENFADMDNDLRVDDFQVEKLCIKDWCFSTSGPDLLFGKDKNKKVKFQKDGNIVFETDMLNYVNTYNDIDSKINYIKNDALKTGEEYLIQNKKGDNCGDSKRCFLASGGETPSPWFRKENDGSWSRFVIEK